jgi:WhiB family redox-sensing transcriptional regulator
VNDWRDDAACRGATKQFEYPHNPRRLSTRETHAIAAAKAICATCPVIESCKQWALTPLPNGADAAYGMIAAGMTPGERSLLQGQRLGPEATDCGTNAGYQWHLRQGEPTCAECKQAHAAAVWDGKKRRREALKAAS